MNTRYNYELRFDPFPSNVFWEDFSSYRCSKWLPFLTGFLQIWYEHSFLQYLELICFPKGSISFEPPFWVRSYPQIFVIEASKSTLEKRPNIIVD